MRRFCTILVATLAFTFSASASVTLQECRDKARENYPLVRRYDLIRATKECNIHNASLSWLPRLELGGGGSWLSNVTDAADIGDILGQMASMIDLSGKKEQPWQYQVSASILTDDERSNLVYEAKITVENDGYLKSGIAGEVYFN